MHPIKKYRQRHGLTLERFAQLVGTTKSVVSRWERGVLPRQRFWKAIENATEGEVTIKDMVEQTAGAGGRDGDGEVAAGARG